MKSHIRSGQERIRDFILYTILLAGTYKHNLVHVLLRPLSANILSIMKSTNHGTIQAKRHSKSLVVDNDA